MLAWFLRLNKLFSMQARLITPALVFVSHCWPHPLGIINKLICNCIAA